MPLSIVVLGMATASLWLPDWRLSSGLRIVWWPAWLAVAITAGCIDGTLTPTGAAMAVLACMVPAVRGLSTSRAVRRVSAVAGIVVAFGLVLHRFPGFTPLVLAGPLRLTPDAIPMRFTASFDAGLAALLVMAFYGRRATAWRQVGTTLIPTLVVGTVTTAVVIAAACAVGLVRPDLKLPGFTGWHLFRLLLGTCVLEEAFFRGVVQDGLARSRFMRSRPSLRWLPLVVASLLFGVAHAAGGMTYVGLATLAGLGYGYAFQVTGRIESAVAAHFMLDAVHFLCFTYPRLAGP